MFGFKFNRTRRNQKLVAARRPVIEGLEGRMMMSTTIIVGDGTLEPITENQPISNNTVATVSAYDANHQPITDLSGFTAQINWGDGKGTSEGTIGPKIDGNYFAIEGSHTYDHAGEYPISVHVVAADGTSADQKVEPADVQDASMGMTPHIISAVAGQQFTSTLAELMDGDTASQETDFTADIRWGDNTQTTDSAQVVSLGEGEFQLIGTHVYATAGRYSASVTVTDPYGEMAFVSCVVNVAAASTTPTIPTTPPGTNPTNPTDPTNPTTPSDPTNPTDPTNPSNPTNPSTPTDPTNPAGPTNPTQPSDPTQPPAGITTPTTPTNPTTPPPQQPVTPTDPTTPDPNAPMAWGKKVSPAFKAKVVEIATELGTDPNNLMGAMGFETGRTFSPKIRNGAGSGAVGLIQFMPSTAKSLGTSTGALAKMTAVQQLDYVYKYLSPYSGRLNNLGDVYMSILYPAAVGKPDSYGLFHKGTKAYAQNKGLDTNKDGVVTRGEAAARVTQTMQEGEAPAYFG